MAGNRIQRGCARPFQAERARAARGRGIWAWPGRQLQSGSCPTTTKRRAGRRPIRSIGCGSTPPSWVQHRRARRHRAAAPTGCAARLGRGRHRACSSALPVRSASSAWSAPSPTPAPTATGSSAPPPPRSPIPTPSRPWSPASAAASSRSPSLPPDGGETAVAGSGVVVGAGRVLTAAHLLIDRVGPDRDHRRQPGRGRPGPRRRPRDRPRAARRSTAPTSCPPASPPATACGSARRSPPSPPGSGTRRWVSAGVISGLNQIAPLASGIQGTALIETDARFQGTAAGGALFELLRRRGGHPHRARAPGRADQRRP